MIPAPPGDPALPALPDALDGELVTNLLRTALADADGAPEILRCQPDYLRYKPGTNCLLGYQMTWLDEAGKPSTLPLHLVLYADGRAARLAAKPALQAQSALAREAAGPPGSRMACLPALGALAQVFPMDRKLPALGLASEWPRLAQGLGADPAGTVDLVRYKPGRKVVLRYPEAPGGPLYGKLHGYERRPEVAGWSAHLAAAGIPTPALRQWWPEVGWLAHAAVPGPALRACRGLPDYAAWMAPAAELLRQLHTLGMPAGPVPPRVDLAGAVSASAAAITQLLPALAPRVRRLAAGIAERLSASPPAETLVHGDFYDDQLVLSEGQLWLLDLDELGRGHPLMDVGNHAAHLWLAGEHAAREAFLAALDHQQPGRWRPDHVAAFEAAALLRLALGPFRHLRPDWPDGVAAGVAAAEACLGRGLPGVSGSLGKGYPQGAPLPGTGALTAGSWSSQRPGRGAPCGYPARHQTTSAVAVPLAPASSDPALPQLAAVLDITPLTTDLRLALAQPDLTVLSAEMVRHKPGRRAVLRYGVIVDGQHATWYGKTFASPRAPAVWEVSRRLADGLRDRLPVPEPLALLPDRRLVVHRALAGAPVEAAILAGDTKLAEQLARALASFHATPVALGRRHDLAAELRPLATRVDDLATQLPQLAELARSCLARVEAAAEAGWPWRWRPVHRDFYPDQVLEDAGRIGFLDLDDAAMSEPVLDVANFRAHLLLMALQVPGRAAGIAAFDRAFATSCASLDKGATAALLRLLMAATLLRLADIHAPRPGGTALAEGLLAACATLLDELEVGRMNENLGHPLLLNAPLDVADVGLSALGGRDGGW